MVCLLGWNYVEDDEFAPHLSANPASPTQASKPLNSSLSARWHHPWQSKGYVLTYIYE